MISTGVALPVAVVLRAWLRVGLRAGLVRPEFIKELNVPAALINEGCVAAVVAFVVGIRLTLDIVKELAELIDDTSSLSKFNSVIPLSSSAPSLSTMTTSLWAAAWFAQLRVVFIVSIIGAKSSMSESGFRFRSNSPNFSCNALKASFKPEATWSPVVST